MLYFRIFCKKFKNYALNFRAFGRKHNCLENYREHFEKFWWNLNRKMEFLRIIPKVVAKNRAFEKTYCSSKNFELPATFPIFPLGGAYEIVWRVSLRLHSWTHNFLCHVSPIQTLRNSSQFLSDHKSIIKKEKFIGFVKKLNLWFSLILLEGGRTSLGKNKSWKCSNCLSGVKIPKLCRKHILHQSFSQ